MKKHLRKMQKRSSRETRRPAVIVVSDASFWQRIVGRYHIAKRWRFPGLLYRPAGILPAARRINVALSVFFTMSSDVRAKGRPFSGSPEKLFIPTFFGKPVGSEGALSIPPLQLSGIGAQPGGEDFRFPGQARSSPMWHHQTGYEQRGDTVPNTATASVPRQRQMTEERAIIGMIPGRRLKSRDMRILSHATLSMPPVNEDRLRMQGAEKEGANMSGVKTVPTTSSLGQRRNIETFWNDDRRDRRRWPPSDLAFDETRGSPSRTNGGALQYLNFKRLEKEIDGIRKRVEDTKETLSEQIRRRLESPDSAVKPAVDLSRISDHVCREIERRIRTERERRGM